MWKTVEGCNSERHSPLEQDGISSTFASLSEDAMVDVLEAMVPVIRIGDLPVVIVNDIDRTAQ
jgi:hypothetical protein